MTEIKLKDNLLGSIIKATVDTVPLDMPLVFLKIVSARHEKIQDPIVKYTIMIEQIQLILDLLGAVAETSIHKGRKVTELTEILNKMRDDFSGMAEWIGKQKHTPDNSVKSVKSVPVDDSKHKEGNSDK